MGRRWSCFFNGFSRELSRTSSAVALFFFYSSGIRIASSLVKYIYFVFFLLVVFLSRRFQTSGDGNSTTTSLGGIPSGEKEVTPLGQEREGKTKRLRRKIERERESSNKNRRSFFTALDESRLSEREKRFSLFSPP